MHHPTPLSQRCAHLALGAVLSSTLLNATTAHADVLYSYSAPISYWADGTGHGFATHNDSPNPQIHLEFRSAGLLSQLGQSYTPVDVTAQLLSWSYAGGASYMKLGSRLGGSISVRLTTDAAGQVLYDQFFVSGAVVIPGLSAYQSSITEANYGGYDQQTLNSNYTSCQGYDLHGHPYCYYLGESISNTPGAGHWTVSDLGVATPPVGSVPEPHSLCLLLAGLSALAWRRRQGVGPA